MATSIGVTVFLESTYKRLHNLCLLPLVTKNNEQRKSLKQSETLMQRKMGTELPEILVRINLKFNFSGQQTCGFGKPQAAKAIWKIIFC